MALKLTTETDSKYIDLENMSVLNLLQSMNKEDQEVPQAVSKVIPAIESLANIIVTKMLLGGRLFYIGAGTSGRLGILDASEIPPTFGVSDNFVIGIMAGGDKAIRKAVEFAEDDVNQAWIDLAHFNLTSNDVLIGIAASGTTPYVRGGINEARKHGLTTGCIVCNMGSLLAADVEYPVEVVVGPEFITGSTRLKSGTAQKLVLNMLSTIAMIKLGRVKGNKMVDMQLTNHKLIDRGIRMIMEATGVDEEKATILLKKNKNVRFAVENYFTGKV